MAQVTASYPFNDPDHTSDLTLLSSDNVLFHIHISLLAFASEPFFRTALTISQPQGQPVPMVEDSETLDTMLRFCYPGADPSFKSLAELHRIADLMVGKFAMEEVSMRARAQIRKFVNAEPLLVFVVAYTLNWIDEAMEAADIVLNGPLFKYASPEDIPELDILPSPRILYRLFRYYATRRDAVYNSNGYHFDIFDYIEKAPCKTHDILPSHPEDTSMLTKSWFIDYCTKLREELYYRHPSLETLCTCDSYAHASALQTAKTCPDCAKGHLHIVFDYYIPTTVHAQIENALSMKFQL
ncbi:uncharacterized protein EV420DRAFT_1528474 [Desarmillaria tabescens]|uniref:BTB domain-containing protein n=1 Tax=Armillaria tabescens TaxID=1929756 RepID=A0AA39NAG6_ARMTA|nr:uncharacterized protein EV420DRAFT_1528474 [Desarmillaria tabescens]KAK0462040.1 hypothetical protein EV420DRAFT_1528474 [Desarmillaria tabescens]